MKVSYGFDAVEGEGSIFLREGELLCYLPNNTSYYFGLSLLDGWKDPIKLVDSLIEGYDEVFVGKNYAEFTKEGKKCTISLTKGSISVDSEFDINIDLDFRRIYDFNPEGRFYNIHNDQGTMFVECVQRESRYWIAVKGNIDLEQKWLEKYYSFDDSRKDTPTAWVHRLGRGKKFTLSFGPSVLIAKKNSSLNATKKKYSGIEDLLETRLKQLTHKDRILAGLPWFFQAWTRDELISMSAYDKKFRKKVLMNYLGSILDDGRLPNRLPHADLGSADSTGLYAYNVRQNLELFNAKEKERLLNFFTDAKNKLEQHCTKDGIIANNPKETWMDTISREGKNIEIQALHANILALIKDLGGSSYLEKYLELVREAFKEKIDNANNDEVRPNIFLAYYFYPELFDKKDWKKKFEKVIQECWQSWGGFTTIGKNAWLYHPWDEGKTDESYHNGNSWYFVNNIAAIVMLDFGKLKDYSIKIYEASKKELLGKGLLGCGAEITSGEALESKGCMFQAWSIATFKELDEKIKR